MQFKRKWVSVWGNAVSVAENRPERYARDITIRYPINIPFAGEALRLTFDNYCGTEAITLSKITVFYGGEFYPVRVNGALSATIPAGEKPSGRRLFRHPRRQQTQKHLSSGTTPASGGRMFFPLSH